VLVTYLFTTLQTRVCARVRIALCMRRISLLVSIRQRLRPRLRLQLRLHVYVRIRIRACPSHGLDAAGLRMGRSYALPAPPSLSRSARPAGRTCCMTTTAGYPLV
jgi:hypothetical protein